MYITALFNSLKNFFLKENYLVSTSLLRIFLGLTILYIYLIHYAQRYVLWSQNGIYLFDSDFQDITYSIYNYFTTNTAFDITFHLGIIVAILFTIGFGGRIVNILNYIFVWSLIERFIHLGDGGDNLLRLVLFFMLFSDNTRFFSLKIKKPNLKKDGIIFHLNTLFHNFAVISCITQLSILYIIAGWYQAMGEKWINGTALYYISQVELFFPNSWYLFFKEHIYLGVLVAYGSFIFKLAYPLLIINKRTKIIAVIGAVFFHLGIAFGMKLFSFSIIIVSVEFLLFTDSEYLKVYSLFKTFKTKVEKIMLPIKRKYRVFNEV
jgi:hypothetical protein